MAKKKAPFPIVLGEAVDEENQRHHHAMNFIMSQVKRLRPWSKLVSAVPR
jgi:hypothetical protein